MVKNIKLHRNRVCWCGLALAWHNTNKGGKAVPVNTVREELQKIKNELLNGTFPYY